MNQVLVPGTLSLESKGQNEKAVIRRLFSELDTARISYCHWKSNCRLEATLAGEEDIDILVDRRQAAKFQGVLSVSGFKLAQSALGGGHPSTFHAIGLDGHTGELVDLHVCHEVYSGDSLVKNYRMPIEGELLANTRELLGVKVPDAACELVYFVLRIALKHLSPIELLKSNRHRSKHADELAWLQQAASRSIVPPPAICDRLFPVIGAELFSDLVNAIARQEAIFLRIRLGWKVAWRLRGTRRLSAFGAAVSRLWRFGDFVRGRLSGAKSLHLVSGGGIVALVGPKATGKSTTANELARRLGRHLNVCRIHAGKPPPTLISWIPNWFVPLARRLLPHERMAVYEDPARRERRDFSLFHVARMALLAHDRRRLLQRALRKAAAGAIVISDRYPSLQPGTIDSSSFDSVALAGCDSWLKRKLMQYERYCYSAIPRPNLVIKLTAPIAIAIARDATRDKAGGPDEAAVRRHWELERKTDFGSTPVVTIDTTGPLEETARQAVNAVWAVL
jgi:thymidylate kinase